MSLLYRNGGKPPPVASIRDAKFTGSSSIASISVVFITMSESLNLLATSSSDGVVRIFHINSMKLISVFLSPVESDNIIIPFNSLNFLGNRGRAMLVGVDSASRVILFEILPTPSLLFCTRLSQSLGSEANLTFITSCNWLQPSSSSSSHSSSSRRVNKLVNDTHIFEKTFLYIGDENGGLTILDLSPLIFSKKCKKASISSSQMKSAYHMTNSSDVMSGLSAPDKLKIEAMIDEPIGMHSPPLFPSSSSTLLWEVIKHIPSVHTSSIRVITIIQDAFIREGSYKPNFLLVASDRGFVKLYTTDGVYFGEAHTNATSISSALALEGDNLAPEVDNKHWNYPQSSTLEATSRVDMMKVWLKTAQEAFGSSILRNATSKESLRLGRLNTVDSNDIMDEVNRGAGMMEETITRDHRHWDRLLRSSSSESQQASSSPKPFNEALAMDALLISQRESAAEILRQRRAFQRVWNCKIRHENFHSERLRLEEKLVDKDILLGKEQQSSCKGSSPSSSVVTVIHPTAATASIEDTEQSKSLQKSSTRIHFLQSLLVPSQTLVRPPSSSSIPSPAYKVHKLPRPKSAVLKPSSTSTALPQPLRTFGPNVALNNTGSLGSTPTMAKMDNLLRALDDLAAPSPPNISILRSRSSSSSTAPMNAALERKKSSEDRAPLENSGQELIQQFERVVGSSDATSKPKSLRASKNTNMIKKSKNGIVSVIIGNVVDIEEKERRIHEAKELVEKQKAHEKYRMTKVRGRYGAYEEEDILRFVQHLLNVKPYAAKVFYFEDNETFSIDSFLRFKEAHAHPAFIQAVEALATSNNQISRREVTKLELLQIVFPHSTVAERCRIGNLSIFCQLLWRFQDTLLPPCSSSMPFTKESSIPQAGDKVFDVESFPQKRFNIAEVDSVRGFEGWTVSRGALSQVKFIFDVFMKNKNGTLLVREYGIILNKYIGAAPIRQITRIQESFIKCDYDLDAEIDGALFLNLCCNILKLRIIGNEA